MTNAEYVLAIDGGGTKTAAALLSWAGDPLASCRAGPANLYRDPVAGLTEIRRVWEMLCRQAGLSPDTAAGRTVMDALEGFRLYLATAEKERLNMAAAPDLDATRFEALLPYAVALDVERPWSDAFAAALARAHPDDPDPMDRYDARWRRGRRWSSGDLGRSVSGSVSAATSPRGT